MDEEPAVRLDECTAVLMTVPLEVARRLESFLLANDVPCKIRKNESMTPEKLAEEAVRSATPEAAKMLDSPLVGRLLRTRAKHAVKAGIELSGAGLAPAYDVLVRPQDLPTELARAIEQADSGVAGQAADPWARPGEEPAPTTVGDVAGGTAAVTALPWDAAWELAARLQEANMPATVLPAGDAPRGSGTIGEDMFQVVVQASDLERATALAGGTPLDGRPTDR